MSVPHTVFCIFSSMVFICRAWLYEEHNNNSPIANRVGLLTGLVTKFTNTEPFQVVNYGIGGMYHPHLDAFGKPLWDTRIDDDIPALQGTGDRIATWLYYLNNVDAGGATVFPTLNKRIPVIKGAAAFWYNLLPNGQIDERTYHAGCPVIIGSKWIANKWIRESGQMYARPCELKP